MKCCVNCKYYEHIRELDNEVDWCHYPNQEGIISNDPEYVKSELSGHCQQYERIEYKQYIEPTPYNLTHIKPDTWYKVDDDSREMFTEDMYAAYVNLCNERKTPHESLKQFKTNYPLHVGECFKLNSNTITVNYRTNYNDKYMQDVIDYKQLIKEINEKIARKIMNNSVFGKAAFDNDPICTEPSIIDQYSNKKRATYEKERDEAIRKINEASPVGKAITNFIAALKKAGLKDEMIPDFNMMWNDNCLTDAEKAAIKEVHTTYHLAMSKMLEKCRECVAILVNCETFEQKMTVLQKYDIIDSDYKLKA
jgi:hypothetical protein